MASLGYAAEQPTFPRASSPTDPPVLAMTEEQSLWSSRVAGAIVISVAMVAVGYAYRVVTNSMMFIDAVKDEFDR